MVTYGLLGLFALVVGFSGWQNIAHRHALAVLPLDGRLVGVGSRTVHVLEAGLDRRGRGPTVILEAGLGGLAAMWQHVLAGVAPHAYVLAYDRPGHGLSGHGTGRRDALAIARDLHAFLEADGVPGPYVLVGHSLGGPYVRTFTGLYPEQVTGMVLVDATHPDLQERSVALKRAIKRVGTLFETLSWLTPLGVVRATGLLGVFTRGFTGHSLAFVTELLAHPAHIRAARAEQRAIESTFAATRRAGDLGDRPLRIVTAGDSSRSGGPDFPALQEEYLGLSARARRDVVAGATHDSLLSDPAHAARVVQAILGVLDELRFERPRSAA